MFHEPPEHLTQCLVHVKCSKNYCLFDLKTKLNIYFSLFEVNIYFTLLWFQTWFVLARGGL